MGCRFDRDKDDYLTDDGEPCDDEHGDRTYHCTARRTCSQHIGFGELTCARCLGRSRMDIRQIVERAALMLPEAMVAGVDSEAANLAGPAADYRVFSARRLIAKQWIEAHLPQRHWERAERNLLTDDDEWHPYSVLTRWCLMLAEDYGLALPERFTIANAAALLDRILGRVAQDEAQDFPLLARELRKCRSHLEAVMGDSMSPERGAPCPECAGRGTFVRLVREYGHWCDDEDCERFHFTTDEADSWVCPRDSAHRWDLESYSRWVEERKGA
jgi:hypothetical protein